MKKLLIAAAAIASIAVAGGAQASEALAKEKGCLGCHAVDKKKVGPAFKDVAAKYKGQADAETKIAGELKSGMVDGKKHTVPKASDDELKTLVKWVLAQ